MDIDPTSRQFVLSQRDQAYLNTEATHFKLGEAAALLALVDAERAAMQSRNEAMRAQIHPSMRQTFEGRCVDIERYFTGVLQLIGEHGEFDDDFFGPLLGER